MVGHYKQETKLIWHCLLINRDDKKWYVVRKTKNKKTQIFAICGKSINKYRKKLLATATKTGLDALKTGSKKKSIKQLKQQESWQIIKLMKKLENQNLFLKQVLGMLQKKLFHQRKERNNKRIKTIIIKMEPHKISKL